MEAMTEKRSRSPNYPALSLPIAIEKVGILYKNLHTHAAPRDVVAKGLGYQSLSGPSATVISALVKYGLIERSGEGWKVSDRSLRILHPHSPNERSVAIREAAHDPGLFAELFERFGEHAPNDDLLHNYLARKAFVPSAVPLVILAFRDTLELLRQESGADGSPTETAPESLPVSLSSTLSQACKAAAVVPQVFDLPTDERPIGRYDFEDGSYVRISAGGDLDTETALDMVETLVQLKRAEITKRKAREGKTQTSDSMAEKKENGNSVTLMPDSHDNER